MTTPRAPHEETFDPRTPEEWAAFRTLAVRMVDDMLTHLADLPAQPTWRPMPDAVRAALAGQPVPRAGIGAEAAYADFVAQVMPYPNGNLHPRFWGWVEGTGTPLGMMADMLAAGLNPHLAGFDHAPALVEHQVVAWMGELLGMPGASGVLLPGGTMASTIGLAVARHAKARELGRDTRALGMQAWPDAAAPAPMVFYGSSETHGWARKAAELMGLGDRAFRRVPVDAEYRIDVRALRAMIAEDRAAGLAPFCVVGTAGTVNTGATDDLTAVADVCRDEGLWFHVDGAFGALVHLSETLRPIVAGMERADSLGFDLHKWGSLPIECACVLVRDPALHHAAFAAPASYLASMTRGLAVGGLPFADRGLDLTRGFKALKAWMSLRADGVDKLARLIEQNVAQTRHLVARIAAHPELELLAPAPLNIACFRYVPDGMSEPERDALNEELLLRLQERGIAVPSSTVLHGRFALRVANVNHRTRRADLDALVDAVLLIGAELARPSAVEAIP
ncbi:pyridoxal phosphate-dependent decarboxylase family protein [Roseisolibacter agri]|uniref:Amino acid decarboxylase n=1 Tax=Roseisolibacter agri TaxID=2014610 RepID=A0AA37Q6Q8_9BACT|nr:pyridoxal-dependent decarboxylase [Roseisolibacter agri]GLC25717.1 amino acid decarboxylase [Roseisolibacter agri]